MSKYEAREIITEVVVFRGENGLLYVNFEVTKGPRVDQSLFVVSEVTFLGQERYFGDAFIVCVL